MKIALLVLSTFFILNSCTYDKSKVTGWDYNNPKNGGFQKVPFEEQETGPGLTLVKGGELYIPLVENSERKELTVRIPSFYMDETEVSNQDWLEYLYWIERTFGDDFPTVFYNALPDTSCWREEVGDYLGYQMNYLRHPAYSNYPVVGVDWMQANNYCSWRTDRVNEMILIREGILYDNPMQQNEPFTTDSYLVGQYDQGTNPDGQLPDLDPSNSSFNNRRGKFRTIESATRNVRFEDGILLPRYRLPTEAEWEYAAKAKVTFDSKRTKKAKKGWKKNDMAMMYKANWKAGNSIFQDNSSLTAPVNSYLPNDYGLYNMHSNVSEWVADVYKSRTEDHIQLFSPLVSDERIESNNYSLEGSKLNKYDEVIYNVNELSNYLRAFEFEVRKRSSIDSIQEALFYEIRNTMDRVDQYGDNGDVVGASGFVREILDEILVAYESQNREAYLGNNYLNMEIYFELKVGISRFVLFHPGQIPIRDQTPEETIRRRNSNNKRDWVSDYDERLDSMAIINEKRVIKGKSFVDEEYLENVNYRSALNKYESACFVGFRCAMNRVGSPVGIGQR